jgi:hypothetical protein
MKTIKFCISICAIALMLPSCMKEKGTVVFRNRSVTNHTYNVVWDGSVITTLYPQEDSKEFDVNAGKHTLKFEFSNTGRVTACSPADPNIEGESKHTFTCSE